MKASSEPYYESYYQRLGIPFWASAPEIRRAYRQMSKRYHPDTSLLDPDVAVQRFQEVQEAYIVLTNPIQRAQYDALLRVRYSAWQTSRGRDSDGVNPFGDSDVLKTRPLSGTELFALLLMAGTLLTCLGLVVVLAWIRQGWA